MAKEVKEELFVKEGLKEKIKGTIFYLDKMVEAWFNEPENLKMISDTTIVNVLKFRSQFLGEEVGPERIDIRWGAGLEDLKSGKKSPLLTIEVPKGKTDKEESGENKNEEKEEENTT